MTRRPQKRRKLSSDLSEVKTGATHFALSSQLGPKDSAVSSPIAEAPGDADSSTCVSCQRSLIHISGGSAKQNQAVACERCRFFMCSVCSRKCTAVPPSIPPTPQLSYSPSPPGSPHRPELDSARQRHQKTGSILQGTPLDECHGTDNENDMQMHIAGRRRQRMDDDDEEGTVVGADDQLGSDTGINEAEANRGNGLLSGCGRTVCKNCSFENMQSGNTTCYDCYGLPSSSAYLEIPQVHPSTISDSSSSYPSTNVSTPSLQS